MNENNLNTTNETVNASLNESYNSTENTEIILCSVCGAELSPDEAHLFEGEYYCEECFEDCTDICDCCGHRFDVDTGYSGYNRTLCGRCYDNYYTHCEDCGALIANEDAYYLDDYEEYPYCEDCYNKARENCAIHDYGYKPDPLFYGNGYRFFGVELEVDNGGHYDENAAQILKIGNADYDDRIYIKTDGSLDDGFEIVSHPMSLDYHKNEMPWQEIMQKLISLGYTSHKAKTCGLHCHIILISI